MDGCDNLYIWYCRNKVEAKGFTCTRQFTAFIDLTQDLETIWRNMDRNARYGIKRAEREQIKYKLNQHYDEFYRMRENLARDKGFTSGLGFTPHSDELIKRYGTLFTAEFGGEVITGNVYLEDKEHILAWMSASNRLEVDKQKASLIGWANRMLHWEAIKYAKEKGIKEFNWGGVWPEEEVEASADKKSLNAFKLSFGAKVEPCYLYQKVYSKRYEFAQRIYHFLRFARKTS